LIASEPKVRELTSRIVVNNGGSVYAVLEKIKDPPGSNIDTGTARKGRTLLHGPRPAFEFRE
jgi:hypothetical protein